MSFYMTSKKQTNKIGSPVQVSFRGSFFTCMDIISKVVFHIYSFVCI